jgi:hypothetical protein
MPRPSKPNAIADLTTSRKKFFMQENFLFFCVAAVLALIKLTTWLRLVFSLLIHYQ